MRITYRNKNVKEYWALRWDGIPADKPMENEDVYPLKYSNIMIKDHGGKVLEAGCGAGRILRYYHDNGTDITGIDFIEVAINKLKEVDAKLKVKVANITSLPFDNESFKYILAFGLFHNLEFGLEKAIQEASRVLEKEGSICVSFRADNIQTKVTDLLKNWKDNQNINSYEKTFHKLNLTRSEFIQIFEKENFVVESIFPVENMPILYKFSFFRSSGHKDFNENMARSEGYQLSWFGNKLQKFVNEIFSKSIL